jgi:hypothetical protein
MRHTQPIAGQNRTRPALFGAGRGGVYLVTQHHVVDGFSPDRYSPLPLTSPRPDVASCEDVLYVLKGTITMATQPLQVSHHEARQHTLLIATTDPDRRAAQLDADGHTVYGRTAARRRSPDSQRTRST